MQANFARVDVHINKYSHVLHKYLVSIFILYNIIVSIFGMRLHD